MTRASQQRPGLRRRRLSAGTAIVVLAVAALTPLVALHIYSVLQIARAQQDHVEHDLEARAELVSATVMGTVDTARGTVQTLAEEPGVTPDDPEGTGAILQAVLAKRPELLNLWAADRAGTVFATARTAPGETLPSIAGERYFQQALATRGPVVATTASIPQLPGVFAPLVAVPIQRGSQLVGSVQAAFRLPALGELARHVTLPENSVVTVFDGQGTILFRSVAPEQWIGVSAAQSQEWQAAQRVQQGTFESRDVDGVDRLHGIEPVPGTDWLATIAIPLPQAQAPIRQTLITQFAFLALLVLLAGLITWRARQLAEAVDAQRRRLRGIIDQLPEGIIIIAPDGNVVLANHALEGLLGTAIRPERPYRPQFERAVGWLDGERRVEWAELPSERARRGEEVHDAPLIVVRPDGTRRDVLVDALPLRNPAGAVAEVLVVFTDVTSLRDIDRAKDEFISVAAHELRNPLAGLRGYAEILLRRAREKGYDEETIRILTAINEQAGRLTELTSRLLDVSRIAMGRLVLSREPTDLAALAREVQQSLQLTTTRHQITLQSRPAQIVGDWDAPALRQVLNNLIGNAIAYAPGGEIAIRLFLEDRQADVFVSDQGSGIAPEDIPHIFERFRRIPRPPGARPAGLGLGLYLSRGIVEAHGGRIGVASRVGVGSTFWFTLPLRADEQSREPSRQAWQEAGLPPGAVRAETERSQG
jgi:signal transduction histidine kinase